MVRKIVEIVSSAQKLTITQEQIVCLPSAEFEKLVGLAESAIDLEREVFRLEYKIYQLTAPKKNSDNVQRNNPSDLLSQKEVAAEWGVSEKALEKWRLTGEGPPYIKMGKGRCGRIRYRRSDITKYVEEQYREHTTHDTAIRNATGR